MSTVFDGLAGFFGGGDAGGPQAQRQREMQNQMAQQQALCGMTGNFFYANTTSTGDATVTVSAPTPEEKKVESGSETAVQWLDRRINEICVTL